MTAIVDEGVSLLAVVEAGRDRKRLDELSVARVIAEVAETLELGAARAQPIVPTTIFILRNGTIRLDGKAPTADEEIAYTAPERQRGQPGDHRSDVFSLGVVMWEALTHERLFEGLTEDATKAAVLEDDIDAPSTRNANIPSELDGICMRALARDPISRYPNAKAMAVEIEGVLRDAGYGRTNEPITAFLTALPKEMFRKPVPVAKPVPAAKQVPAANPVPVTKLPKLKTGTIMGLPQPKPPADTVPGVPSVDVEDKPGHTTAPGMGIPTIKPADTVTTHANDKSTAQTVETPADALGPLVAKTVEKPVVKTVARPAANPVDKPVEPISAPSMMKGAATVMGVPSLGDALAPAGPPAKATDTIMGVPRLAELVSDEPVGPAVDGPAVVALGKADEKNKPAAVPLVPAPPILPKWASSPLKPASKSGEEPHTVPRHIASAETQIVPPVATAVDETPRPLTGTPTPPQTPRARSPNEFEDEPSGSPAESSPFVAKENTTGGRDVLAGWAWQTGGQAAIDDDDMAVPPPSRRPLFIAIGSAVGVLGIIVIVAFASGGSKSDDKEAGSAKLPEVALAGSANPAAQPVEPTAANPGSNTGSANPGSNTGSANSAEPGSANSADPGSASSGSATGSATPSSATGSATGSAGSATDPGHGSATDPGHGPAATEPSGTNPSNPTTVTTNPSTTASTTTTNPSTSTTTNLAAKTDPKSDPKTAVKTDPKTDPKTTAKTDPKAAAKVDPKTDPKTDPKAAAKVDPKKADPPKVAKIDPPKKADPPKKKVDPKPVHVATAVKPKPIDPYPDAKPDAEASYRNGVQAFARGDTTAALTSLRSALDSNPRYAPTWRGLGLVYEKLGDRNQAVRAYRRYLQLAPSAGDAEQIRGRLERLGS